MITPRTTVGAAEATTVRLTPEVWRDDGRTLPPRWSQAELLRATDPLFHAPLAAFLAHARGLGIPVAINNTWRPWFTQADKLRSGASRVDTSYHNHVTADLQPAALSADLMLGSPPEGSALQGAAYRDTMGKALRALALQYGLAMGWFGIHEERTQQSALTLPLGWDPWHIQLLHPPYSIGELRDILQDRYLANGVMPAVADTPLPPDVDTATTDIPDDTAPPDAADDAPTGGMGTMALLAVGALTLGAIALASSDAR